MIYIHIQCAILFLFTRTHYTITCSKLFSSVIIFLVSCLFSADRRALNARRLDRSSQQACLRRLYPLTRLLCHPNIVCRGATRISGSRHGSIGTISRGSSGRVLSGAWIREHDVFARGVVSGSWSLQALVKLLVLTLDFRVATALIGRRILLLLWADAAHR